MFETYQLAYYYGQNPYVKGLCEKFYNFVGSQPPKDFLQFEQYLMSNNKPKVIYVSKTYHKWYVKKVNEINELRKRPINIPIKYHYQITSDGFVPIFSNTFEINSFEDEYLTFNFKFSPINISHSINIWDENKQLIKKHFNTDKDVNQLKIDTFWGETSEYFHLGYNKYNFFIKKEYCEHPINKFWKKLNVDVDQLNNLHKKYTLSSILVKYEWARKFITRSFYYCDRIH